MILSIAAAKNSQYLYASSGSQLSISPSGENINTGSISSRDAFLSPQLWISPPTVKRQQCHTFWKTFFFFVWRSPRNRTRRQTMQDSYVVFFRGSVVPPHFTAKKNLPNINAEWFDWFNCLSPKCFWNCVYWGWKNFGSIRSTLQCDSRTVSNFFSPAWKAVRTDFIQGNSISFHLRDESAMFVCLVFPFFGRGDEYNSKKCWSTTSWIIFAPSRAWIACPMNALDCILNWHMEMREKRKTTTSAHFYTNSFQRSCHWYPLYAINRQISDSYFLLKGTRVRTITKNQ